MGFRRSKGSPFIILYYQRRRPTFAAVRCILYYYGIRKVGLCKQYWQWKNMSHLQWKIRFGEGDTIPSVTLPHQSCEPYTSFAYA